VKLHQQTLKIYVYLWNSYYVTPELFSIIPLIEQRLAIGYNGNFSATRTPAPANINVLGNYCSIIITVTRLIRSDGTGADSPSSNSSTADGTN
jgi:hypothetical protein